MIIVTLTKLFVIRIVANVRSESLRSMDIFLSLSLFPSSSSLTSEGESEKNAISDADTNPDTPSSKQAMTAEMIAPKVGVMKCTSSAICKKRNVCNIYIFRMAYRHCYCRMFPTVYPEYFVPAVPSVVMRRLSVTASPYCQQRFQSHIS